MNDESNLLMLRNIHPHFFNNGRVGSGGFAPSEDHNYLLSVDFDILSSPADSRNRHQNLSGLPSAGVFGITIGEFENHNVECRADPEINNNAHAVADFNDVRNTSKSQVTKTGRKLAALASARGKLD